MHASGIHVDDECSQAFANFSGKGFIQYRIKEDRFRADVTKNFAASERSKCFQEMQEAMDLKPSFIVAKGVGNEQDKWLLIFYMPEGSTVRDRMVYASSTNAFKDGLGSANFEHATMSVGKKSEVNEAEYENLVKKLSEDDILTLEEKLKIEAETSSHLSMSAVKSRAIVGLPIKASEASLDAITNVGKATVTTAILLLKEDTETLEVQEQGNFSFETAAAKLPAGEPRYVLQSFSHEHESKQASSYVFVYYCPESIKPKLKMFYSTCKQVVMKVCETLGITINKSIELSSTAELTTAYVMDELYPVSAAKKVFKKPGRPGRGNARLIGASDAQQ